MLRQGPIPAFFHGVAEYLAAALFIAAPFLFGFDSSAATAVSIVVGLGILVITASTAFSTGLAKVIPIGIHVVLDFVAAAIMLAAPFLFGFSDENAPTVFFIVLGVVHVLLTIATRFQEPRTAT
ncbi:MAG: hypothetical protein H0V40_00235 [Actinobacteria bacterium]|nr:hypothetical protein [Actinomycetota bacterium]